MESGDGHPGMPRWVKFFVLGALVLLVLVVVLVLSGGQHGPAQHTPSVGTMPVR
jgi:hypothetical protein